MKKILTLMLALSLAVAFAACNDTKVNDTSDENEIVENDATNETEDKNVKVMTHAEFEAAALDSEVVVDTYIQAKQSWWDNKGTFYTQAEDGAYFLYEMPCTEEEYNKLVPGTKVRITGYKAEWSGEIEIIDAKYEILEGEFFAEAFDATSLLGTDELIKHQNELVAFKGMTVKAVNYKNDEPGDDIYLTLAIGENEYAFCVEVYLTGPETDVYKTVGTLKEGDKIDVEGFLYWYEGANTHITSISVVTD